VERDMTVSVSTLRPGLLVNIKTSIKGNVSYDKSEEAVKTKGKTEISTWETEKTVLDAAEQKGAVEVRSKARNLVVGVCAASEFGLLCPKADKKKLDAAFAAARELCAAFNAKSKVTRVKFNAIAASINPNDLEAVRAINGEVRGLLAEMKTGLKDLDVERVRDAAERAKKLGNMLSTDAQSRIEDAISAVRKTAVAMVKAGDQAAKAIDKETIAKLNSARTAFLDLDDAKAVKAPTATTGRALDLHADEDEDEAPAAPKAPKARAAAKVELD
jgi:hypothetical protein